MPVVLCGIGTELPSSGFEFNCTTRRESAMVIVMMGVVLAPAVAAALMVVAVDVVVFVMRVQLTVCLQAYVFSCE